jgi:uncharacterized protein (TIGR02996 family)
MQDHHRRTFREFLRDIAENPADDTPRLILADWLQDHGTTRDHAVAASVIRVALLLTSRSKISAAPQNAESGLRGRLRRGGRGHQGGKSPQTQRGAELNPVTLALLVNMDSARIGYHSPIESLREVDDPVVASAVAPQERNRCIRSEFGLQHLDVAVLQMPDDQMFVHIFRRDTSHVRAVRGQIQVADTVVRVAAEEFNRLVPVGNLAVHTKVKRGTVRY